MSMSESRDVELSDELLYMVGYLCMKREARLFSELDVSDVPDNPKFEKRILRSIRKREWTQKCRTVIKLALVACLAALATLLTACICIPDVREAVWNVWVELYDDNISITFADSNIGNTGNQSVQNGGTGANNQAFGALPSTIEQKASLDYLPQGWYMQEAIVGDYGIISTIYNAEGHETFDFAQYPIKNTEIGIDCEEGDIVTNMYIHGREAILVEYPDEPGTYTLVWRDKYYAYFIGGMFSSDDELIKIAESVYYP